MKKQKKKNEEKKIVHWREAGSVERHRRRDRAFRNRMHIAKDLNIKKTIKNIALSFEYGMTYEHVAHFVHSHNRFVCIILDCDTMQYSNRFEHGVLGECAFMHLCTHAHTHTRIFARWTCMGSIYCVLRVSKSYLSKIWYVCISLGVRARARLYGVQYAQYACQSRMQLM